MAFTTYKIHTMMQIRGWIPGAITTTCTVTAKYEDWWTRIQHNGAFSLNCPNLQRTPGHRVQLSYQEWMNINVGSSLTIIRVGGLYGEELFVPNDLGSSDGDFAIDVIFLIGEGIVSLVAWWGLLYKPRRTVMQELFQGSSTQTRRYRR
jgi:hypothetical protein